MIVKELDNLLKKYKSLGSTGNLIDRLKWGQEDLDGLRERLRSNINLLTTFNASLAKYVPLYLLLYPPLLRRPKLIFSKSSVASSLKFSSSLGRYLLPGAPQRISCIPALDCLIRPQHWSEGSMEGTMQGATLQRYNGGDDQRKKGRNILTFPNCQHTKLQRQS